MTSRERVLTALKHKEPDKIPFDLGSTILTGITSIAYRNLLSYMGIERKEEAPIVDVMQQLALVDEDVLRRLNVDLRGIYLKDPSTWHLKIEDAGDYTRFTDQWGIGWRMPKVGGYYYDMYHHPLTGATIDDLDHYPWPEPTDRGRIEDLREEARKLREETDYAVIMGSNFGAGMLEMTIWMQGYEQGYANLAGDPAFTSKLLDKILELKMEFWDLCLSELGEYLDVVIDGDDLGFQDTLMISLDMYRKYLKPRQKELYSFIKSKTSAYLLFHSCGSIYDLIPGLIDVGVDILNPIQVRAAKMDTKTLKKEFGDALTFWGGGVDTQEVLPRGKPQDVKDEVKRRIDDLAPGGGYVFNTVHNIQPDVPPENIMAMWEALQEYGVY